MIQLTCPDCGSAMGNLTQVTDSGMPCAVCGFILEMKGGILFALPPGRRRAFEKFLTEYSAIRKAEGRGSENPDYYLALPYRDLTGKNSSQWAIRGKSYAFLENRILPGFEEGLALHILDLGAGNGWLSYRLTVRGHCPVAVDIVTDSRDGLGAAFNYQARLNALFPRVAAEFDHLPFAAGQFDLAIFNSSFHYSTDCTRTLIEARRCLKSTGSVIVVDSPIYRHREDGERMKEERHRYFEMIYGFRSDAIPSVEYLCRESLGELAARLGLRWRAYRPWYGWKWHLRPLSARLKRRRPPSRFHVLVGSWTL